jgi:hypothetical protein
MGYGMDHPPYPGLQWHELCLGTPAPNRPILEYAFPARLEKRYSSASQHPHAHAVTAVSRPRRPYFVLIHRHGKDTKTPAGCQWMVCEGTRARPVRHNRVRRASRSSGEIGSNVIIMIYGVVSPHSQATGTREVAVNHQHIRPISSNLTTVWYCGTPPTPTKDLPQLWRAPPALQCG